MYNSSNNYIEVKKKKITHFKKNNYHFNNFLLNYIMNVKSKKNHFTFESFKNNKYFRTVLISYYILTRNIDVLQASEKFKDPELLKKIFEEYKLYTAGFDVEIEQEDKPKNVFKAPEEISFKSATILQILKKNPKV